VAYSGRVNPMTANRLIDSARGILNQFTQDVFIYTDHYKYCFSSSLFFSSSPFSSSPSFPLALYDDNGQGS
jgi:hypothetical protein